MNGDAHASGFPYGERYSAPGPPQARRRAPAPHFAARGVRLQVGKRQRDERLGPELGTCDPARHWGAYRGQLQAGYAHGAAGQRRRAARRSPHAHDSLRLERRSVGAPLRCPLRRVEPTTQPARELLVSGVGATANTLSTASQICFRLRLKRLSSDVLLRTQRSVPHCESVRIALSELATMALPALPEKPRRNYYDCL